MINKRQKTLLVYFLAAAAAFYSVYSWKHFSGELMHASIQRQEESVPLHLFSARKEVLYDWPSTDAFTLQRVANPMHAAATTIPSFPSSASSVDSSEPSKPSDAGSDEEDLNDRQNLDEWCIQRGRYTLSIPDINLTAPINIPCSRYWNAQKWDLLEKQLQAGLLYGTVAYPHSVHPGARGSLIIAGHSSPPSSDAEQSAFGHIFSQIPELVVGQRIIVHDGADTIVYEVQEKKISSAADTTILQQQREPRLILITCYPVGSSKERMVVTAKLVEE